MMIFLKKASNARRESAFSWSKKAFFVAKEGRRHFFGNERPASGEEHRHQLKRTAKSPTTSTSTPFGIIVIKK
jgi:hypothetical protein